MTVNGLFLWFNAVTVVTLKYPQCITTHSRDIHDGAAVSYGQNAQTQSEIFNNAIVMFADVISSLNT